MRFLNYKIIIKKRNVVFFCFFFYFPVVGCISVCDIINLGLYVLSLNVIFFHAFIQVHSVAEECISSIIAKSTCAALALQWYFISLSATSVISVTSYSAIRNVPISFFVVISINKAP